MTWKPRHLTASALLALACLAMISLVLYSCKPEAFMKGSENPTEDDIDELMNEELGGEKGKTRLVVSFYKDDTPWVAQALSWVWFARKTLEKNEPNFQVNVKVDSTEAQQRETLQSLQWDENVDGVVILTPSFATGLSDICEKLWLKGVIVTAVSNNILFPDTLDVYVTGDNVRMGNESVEAIAKVLGGENAKGKILAFTDLRNSALRSRLANFRDGTRRHPDLELEVVSWPNEGINPREAMLHVLEREKTPIDAVWTGWDEILLQALPAYESTNRDDVKIFVGGGGDPRVNRMIQDGHPLVPYNITYPPRMLYEAIMTTAKHIKRAQQSGIAHETPEILILPLTSITRENAANFLGHSWEF